MATAAERLSASILRLFSSTVLSRSASYADIPFFSIAIAAARASIPQQQQQQQVVVGFGFLEAEAGSRWISLPCVGVAEVCGGWWI